MKRMLDPDPFGLSPWAPAADVYRGPGGWLIKFDLAGVRPEEVEIRLHGRHLILDGVRRDWSPPADHRCHSLEIAYHRFFRSLELPSELTGARVTTEYRDGMLLVQLWTDG